MISLDLLGPPDLRGPDPAPLGRLLAQPKRFALLAVLGAAPAPGFVRRDRLLGLFWPELDAAHARNSLSKALQFLREHLGADAVVSRGQEEIGLDPARVECDVGRFEVLLAAGKPGEALALCRGEFLSGFLLGDNAAFDQWLDEERERIRRRAVDAAWTLAAAGHAGDSFAASRWVRWALLQTPSDEAALRRGMRLLAKLGDRGGALRVHAEFVQRLAKEFEAEPSPETQTLLASIRQGA